ncbi:MAG: hypothetical protein ACRDLP_12310 [Solirubrobacteraceae bacterium]
MRAAACRASFLALVVALTVAYGAPAAVRVSPSQVSAPVSVQVGHLIPCPGDHKFCGWRRVRVWITFTARAAASAGRSHYTVNMSFTSTAACSHGHPAGQSGPPLTGLHAGQRVRVASPVTDCPGVFHGDVIYDARDNTAYRPGVVIPSVGQGTPIDGVLVGPFHFALRTQTRPRAALTRNRARR